MTGENQAARGGYPLIALFIFVAVCAVLSAILAPFARATIGNDGDAATPFLISIGIGALITLLLGIVVGFFHHEQPYGMMLGGVIGFVIGMVIGPVTLIPLNATFTLVMTTFGGSILLVIVAAALRMSSRFKVETSPFVSNNQAEPIDAVIVDKDNDPR